MAFTTEEQARLGEIYAPLLFQHNGDVAPVSPAEYVRRSALWSNAFLDLTAKEFWGSQPTAPFPTPPLPRMPELLPGTIAASADDPDAADRTVLATHLSENADPAFFLDHGGWNEFIPPPDLVPALPEPGEVTDDSLNLVGAVAAAQRRWTHIAPDPELDQHIGWYTVEAFDTVTDLTPVVEKLFERNDPAIDHFFPVIVALPRPSWLILYHFFFPAHRERISRCEFIATLRALGIELPPQLPVLLDTLGIWDEDGVGVHFDSRGLQLALHENGVPFALPVADRLGDFVSICVVAPGPFGPDTPSPLGLDADQFEPPLFVGFGRKAAAIEIDPYKPMTVPMMEIASGPELDLIGNHPKVFVAAGTHNIYPTAGVRPVPTDPTRETICEFVDVGTDDEPPISKKQRQKHVALASVLKAASLGPILGGIAALVEALRDASPDAPVDILNESPQDAAPGEQGAGLILAPAELVDGFASDDQTVVRPWAGTPEQRVLNGTFENGRLSWGPPALEDPFRRRHGQPMPQFLGPFVSALGCHLEVVGG
jgi:hypothetical protein